MCYDIKATLESQLKRARRKGDKQAEQEILDDLVPLTDLPLYHASGFSHPEMLIYTTESPDFPIVATWGLIPNWVKDKEYADKIWNQTLNARGETIFEKPSFKYSAEHSRCIIHLDGFYEHHHFGKKTYPYFIFREDKQPMSLAGLWTQWRNEKGGYINTFAIVTSEANSLLARIHNNPKLNSPRMPLILSDSDEEKWLGFTDDNEQLIKKMVRPYNDIKLASYTVGSLRGENYIGNIEKVSQEVLYPELNTLF